MLRALQARKRVNYGSGMAIGMSIGFLFLGGGRLAFGRGRKAVAGLLISLFPHFPSESSDNRSHLQALRHLYVLGVENRQIEAIDVESWESVKVKVEIHGDEVVKKETPCLLPEKHKIKSVRVVDEAYFSRKVKVQGAPTSSDGLRVYVMKKNGGGGGGGGAQSGSATAAADPSVRKSIQEEDLSYLKNLRLWNLKLTHTFSTNLLFCNINKNGIIDRGCIRATYDKLISAS